MRQMDDAGDDSRYPHKPYYGNSYSSSSHRPKPPLYPPQPVDQFDDEDDEDSDQDDELDEDIGEEGHGVIGNGYRRGPIEEEDEEDDFERHPKKRKLKNLASGYEFAPRVMVPDGVGSYWSDSDTFVLLDAWGDRFLQLGRKSLRSEDWRDVAEKVSDMVKAQRTEGQCRSRLDVLKKKYRKEKERAVEMGSNSSKWIFFKKMDMLMVSPPRQELGLACGVDSGEYVFMNPRVYLDRSNGLDEMRDSPEESETDGDDDDSDGLPPTRVGGNGGEADGASLKLLANSIQKFGLIYEKIESSKRQQMMELERMRVDFDRELELQKKHILERAQVEIAKLQEEEEEDTDDSEENLSE